MNRFLLLFTLLLMACHQSNSAVDDMLKDNGTTVLIFLNTECPICKKYSGSFKPLLRAHEKNAHFFFVFPGQQDEAAIIEYCKYDSIPLEYVIRDTDYRHCKVFGASTTPQALIYKNKELQYTGKIDDRFTSISSHKSKATVNYIEKALFSLQKNETVAIAKTNPVGCFIEPD